MQKTEKTEAKTWKDLKMKVYEKMKQKLNNSEILKNSFVQRHSFLK